MTPSSPVDSIEKAMEGNRIQGMVRSIDQYRNGDPKAVADGSYAQVLYALTDYKHDVQVLWDFAVAAARQAEATKRELAELRKLVSECSDALSPFADAVFNDNGDMTVNLGSATGDDYVRAYFTDRRARALIGGSHAEG